MESVLILIFLIWNFSTFFDGRHIFQQNSIEKITFLDEKLEDTFIILPSDC